VLKLILNLNTKCQSKRDNVHQRYHDGLEFSFNFILCIKYKVCRYLINCEEECGIQQVKFKYAHNTKYNGSQLSMIGGMSDRDVELSHHRNKEFWS
jgi:hypothetical protein